MNGRVYDPVLGRFLSADPNVDDARDAQGFNRYSYVGNNPLGATDPSGYFSLKDGLKIVATVAVAVVGAMTGQYYLTAYFQGLGFGSAVAGGIAGGLGGGSASGFAGSLLNGGTINDAFKAGVIGGIAGAVTGGLLGKIGAQDYNWFEKGIAHGVVQGGAAEATGGEFRHGFYAGFAVGATEANIGHWAKGSEAKGITAAAAIGGTAAALGGGKFANGAVGGAFSYLFNQLSEKVTTSPKKMIVQIEAKHANSLAVDSKKQPILENGKPITNLRLWERVIAAMNRSRDTTYLEEIQLTTFATMDQFESRAIGYDYAIGVAHGVWDTNGNYNYQIDVGGYSVWNLSDLGGREFGDRLGVSDEIAPLRSKLYDRGCSAYIFHCNEQKLINPADVMEEIKGQIYPRGFK
jgi:hypothetical protein